ncbi:hypothetical protein BV882_32515 [Streptomyces sp. 46]|nr:hypothetical protein BV882_32515 [Streptomyces sp. 46]
MIMRSATEPCSYEGRRGEFAASRCPAGGTRSTSHHTSGATSSRASPNAGGLAGEPSRIDTRTLALKDVTAVGILSRSPGLDATIRAYADKAVDPRPWWWSPPPISGQVAVITTNAPDAWLVLRCAVWASR